MVSIIIVNYKQLALTIELIKSIKNLCIYPNYEIIVVDNEAEFENGVRLKECDKEIVYIPLSSNTGFAAANNIGAKIAFGDLLFFVNNDTIITSGLINTLANTFYKSNDAGIVCPVIKFYDEPEKIQYAGFSKINAFSGRNKILTKPLSNEVYKTEYAHGAAMLMKKKMYDAIGGLDESYFLYYEELDLSAKVKAKGYNIYVDPSATIYHRVSSSTGKDSPLKSYYLTRNRILFMRKNFTTKKYKIYLAFHFLISLPINILKFLLKFKFQNLKKYLLGTMDGIYNKTGYKKIN
jgi:GT2 family glycosyltransferase